jgi:putative ABC transport system permease protein
MERLLSTLGEFARDLRAQRLRTFLTVFGIVWGTVAVVVLLAFGTGFRTQTGINMHGMGEGIVVLFPGSTTKPFEGFGTGRPISLIEDDVPLIASQVPGIRLISPEYGWGEHQLRVGENIINTSAAGVVPDYGEIRNIIPEPGGRFIDDVDVRERKRVALIGNEVRRQLYGDGDPIGKTLLIDNTPFLVIGVMQKKTQSSSYNRRDQDRVFIPVSTSAAVFGQTHLSNIVYTPRDARQAKEVDSQVRSVLAKKYKFDPEDLDAVWIWNTAQLDEFIFYFFLAFNVFMGLIGSFTLAVGGIGVANIMFIVVQERLREIGIRRAVGATRRHIMVQFFSETLFIIVIGSVIGFLLAVGITQALKLLPIKEFVGTPEISPVVAAATCGILTIVGLAAGLLPARRAARANVVDCLRA